MSIATDIASLKIMSDVYKRKELPELLQTTATSLEENVPYIDWVGIYFFEREGKMTLAAASDIEEDLAWEANGELKFPLKNSSNEAVGIMVVRSREAIAFDVTDVSTLETIAHALGEMSFAN
ncbi:GAF domain-containing protein [Salipaludibacillus sp. LMS25]|jgi:putative methionine-R-sulfoxide reductase with GAF domain|uniref:GAF domain-containing protein n=1 Tax=Salipaludibacillus sp. LMS25 TaxID=2924031 RepID=UPI0020D02F62|nr:GAF domain-containing protein [Salipaludibacillus sp. LMS25]UTR13982.1 GAF domain-containing protein [Salipaludibacillus sp. LMS25]